MDWWVIVLLVVALPGIPYAVLIVCKCAAFGWLSGIDWYILRHKRGKG